MKVVQCLGKDEAFEKCFFGWGECKDKNPCPMHDTWKVFKADLRQQMDTMNIKEAAIIAWPDFN